MLLSCLCEECKNSSAVIFHPFKMGMVLVIVPGRMLQYKYTIWRQHILFEDQHGQVVDILQGIRRPGKDKIILLGVLLHEFEHVAFYDMQLVADAQFFGCFLYEIDITLVALHQYQFSRAPRCQFITYAACAAEDVACPGPFDIHHIVQDVEEALFCNIGSGSCGGVGWRAKPAPAECAAYNAHA